MFSRNSSHDNQLLYSKMYFSDFCRRVAGLNSARAKKILDHRDKNGPFVNRSQIREIKGIGPKSYEQCAGFIRLLPETRGGGRR